MISEFLLPIRRASWAGGGPPRPQTPKGQRTRFFPSILQSTLSLLSLKNERRPLRSEEVTCLHPCIPESPGLHLVPVRGMDGRP